MLKPRVSAFLVLGFLMSTMLLTGAAPAAAAEKDLKVAIFAGGCFWCVESDFDAVPGVVRTTSGYIGGFTPNPTYKQVTSKDTGHYEAVQIHYDPKRISYKMLVGILWRSVDPTDDGGQFCDRGDSYKTAVFATSPEQKRIAEESKREIEESGTLKDPIVTAILEAAPFFPAEEYHQNFYKKNPVRYKFYRYRCGRDARVEALWGKEAHRGIAKH